MIYLVIIALLIILIFPYLVYQSKKPSGFYWTMDDENLESCLFTYGCLVGQSVGS